MAVIPHICAKLPSTDAKRISIPWIQLFLKLKSWTCKVKFNPVYFPGRAVTSVLRLGGGEWACFAWRTFQSLINISTYFLPDERAVKIVKIARRNCNIITILCVWSHPPPQTPTPCSYGPVFGFSVFILNRLTLIVSLQPVKDSCY